MNIFLNKKIKEFKIILSNLIIIMTAVEYKRVCDMYNNFYDKILSQFGEDENFDRLFIPSINDYEKSCIFKNEMDELKDENKKIETDDYLISIKNKEKKIKKKQRFLRAQKALEEIENKGKIK